jgi:hypothetical protein
LTEEAERINKQQGDLGLDIQDYPMIDELKLQVKPHEELWKL